MDWLCLLAYYIWCSNSHGFCGIFEGKDRKGKIDQEGKKQKRGAEEKKKEIEEENQKTTQQNRHAEKPKRKECGGRGKSAGEEGIEKRGISKKRESAVNA
ncbi:MAG: hypothetical protein U5M51_08415 [Emticicia sp.]|nr:hypothetical protein [Emticicia sp.]